jgi:predicted glycosyltransferase involved in capsule biosynthesis
MQKINVIKSRKKIDLKDFTFLIPVRFDTIIRIENFLMSIQYLLQNFETNIIVIEADGYDNGIIRKLISKRVQYIFIEDKDPVYYKTKYVNMLTLESNTPYIGIWDTDVIIPKLQIFDAILKLREGFEIAYPYDGKFYDTSEIIRELYLQKKNINVLTKNRDKMSMIYGDQMVGGAVFVNKVAFISAGMESEKFYGWGSEDYDRHDRWQIFGYNIYRSSGGLFHFSHPRGINSKFRSNEQTLKTYRERQITKESSLEEIRKQLIM